MAPSLLFIPDISGFTRFVSETEVRHGRHIIAELLDLIIESDELGLVVSELEGDAVFFYRDGPLPDFGTLVRQARKTFEAFHTHLRRYETHRICDCGACSAAHRLSLKIVAHAGPIERISVRGFEKPYGTDVIIAHRLLKNDLEEPEYLLVTDSVLGGSGTRPVGPDWCEIGEGAAHLEDLGQVPYHYVPLTPLKLRLPDPPAPEMPEKSPHPVAADVHVGRDPEELYALIPNLDLRLSWNRSAEEIEYRPNRVNRVGTPHRCLINGNLLQFETITNDFGKGRLVYGELLHHHPLVDDFASYYIVEPEGSGSRVRLEVHFRPKRFPMNLLLPVARFQMRRLARGMVAAIKEAAESAPGMADRATELARA